MIMDMATELRVARAQLSADPDDWCWVRLYRARDGAGVRPGPSWGCNPIWDDASTCEFVGPQILLQPSANRPWTLSPFPGRHFLGDPEWYRTGLPLDARKPGETGEGCGGEIWEGTVGIPLAPGGGFLAGIGIARGGSAEGGSAAASARFVGIARGGSAEGGSAPASAGFLGLARGGSAEGGSALSTAHFGGTARGGSAEGGKAHSGAGFFGVVRGGSAEGGKAPAAAHFYGIARGGSAEGGSAIIPAVGVSSPPRVTQVAVEVLVAGRPAARATQVVAEVLVAGRPAANVTQVVVEVLRVG